MGLRGDAGIVGFAELKPEHRSSGPPMYSVVRPVFDDAEGHGIALLRYEPAP